MQCLGVSACALARMRACVRAYACVCVCVYVCVGVCIGVCVCVCVLHSSFLSAFLRIWKKRVMDQRIHGPTDGWTYGWTDQQIDRPSYRVARMHLKITNQAINNSSMFELKDFIVISYPLNVSTPWFNAITFASFATTSIANRAKLTKQISKQFLKTCSNESYIIIDHASLQLFKETIKHLTVSIV